MNLDEEAQQEVAAAAIRLEVKSLSGAQLDAELTKAQEHDPVTGYHRDCAAVVALRVERAQRQQAAATNLAEAQALGFDTAEQAKLHAEWLQGHQDRFNHALGYQASREAAARRKAAGVPDETWVTPLEFA